MGANAGPDIVSDGLVLALDAADNNSFRGEPTENLVPSGQRTCSSNFTRRGYHVEQWFYALETNVFGRADATKISITPTGNNSQPYADWGFTAHKSGGSQVGDVYTVSFDYKVTKNTTVPSLGVVYANGYKSPTSAGAASLSNETHTPLEDGWTRFSETATITTAGNTWWRFGMSSNNNETEVYVDNFQIELNSSRTRFVDGTRGTTVATGGGWKDISGNDNHGEILNGTSTSNDGSVLGALDFDGTNDYIDLGTQLNNLTVFTVEGVFKTDITGGADTFQVIFGAGPLNTSNYTNISIGNLTGSYPDESFHVVLKAHTLQFYVRNGANFYFDQKYHHFVVNTEANKNAVYIDGVEQSLTYSQGSSAIDWGGINSLGASNVCAIGRRSYNGGNGYFNGNIPFIRVYNRSLTEKEILANYNSLKSRFGL